MDFREIHFCSFGVFVLQLVTFNEFIGFGVIFCIYESILKIDFYTFRKCSEVWTMFVRNVLFFLWFVVICCLPPHPHPRRQSKFSSGGKLISVFSNDYLRFLWKSWIKWKMVLKWLRRVAFEVLQPWSAYIYICLELYLSYIQILII